MKRIEEGSRVLYVRRHRAWSFMLLLAGLVLLSVAPEAWRRKDWGFSGVLAGGALACLGAAVANLVKAWVLVIDRGEGRVHVLARRIFRRTHMREYLLKDVRVRVRGHVSVHTTKSSTVRRERQEVVVEFSDGSAYELLGGVGAPYGEAWGHRLAGDLGGEMIVDARSEW